MTEIIEPGLESALKNHKERMNSLYSESSLTLSGSNTD